MKQAFGCHTFLFFLFFEQLEHTIVLRETRVQNGQAKKVGQKEWEKQQKNLLVQQWKLNETANKRALLVLNNSQTFPTCQA